MYTKPIFRRTSIFKNDSQEGETIEQKVERMVANKEPIKDGAPLIYTERKDGVLPGFDIRTNRWEVAADVTDKMAKSETAKREQKAKMSIVKDEPIQGTTNAENM